MKHTISPAYCASLLLTLAALPLHAQAQNQAYLIGGGSAIDSAQSQIELNIDYARTSLEALGYQTRLWFNDGNASAPDVHEIHYELLDQASPLSRISGMLDAELTEYRNHQLERVEGSTRRDALVEALNQSLQQHNADDNVLLVYNGHGQKNPDNLKKHTLELWQGDVLTVADLHDVLANGQAKHTRYLMTQCYSGAFHELTTAKPIPTDGSAAPICGFSAVSPHTMSEGCSASLALQDYRDYTTGFFAAINGRDRLDIPVGRKADFNLDKVVTPREAHWYTLGYVDNADIAWSSSEYYLHNWQPWDLRWIAQDADIEYENIYSRLATFNARRAGFTQKGLALVQALRVEKQRLQGELQRITQQLNDNLREQQALQLGFIERLSQRWPSLFQPYTKAHQALIARQGDEINRVIRQDPEYSALESLQNQVPVLMRESLTLERELARAQRIFHLRHLSRVLDRFKRFAKPEQQAEYQALEQCESVPLS